MCVVLLSGTPPMSASSADSDQSAHSADPASVAAALKDIKMAIQATRVLQHQVGTFCFCFHTLVAIVECFGLSLEGHQNLSAAPF